MASNCYCMLAMGLFFDPSHIDIRPVEWTAAQSIKIEIDLGRRLAKWGFLMVFVGLSVQWLMI